ncbi:hypothetical protein Q767_12970 [Flavobacterium enshiense DK69]|uniref:Lipoprotein n=1 Tax=Flavobacterium enshiense DK69 TaxID=1107311 RepID=A0A0A2N1Z0_9FLAO|nr:hypothetical protein Q767_12970 [Flavobacterium enshiense DK69]
MKRLLLALTMLAMLSCEKDDCNCDAEYAYLHPSGEIMVETHNVPIDCDSKQPLEDHAPWYFIRCK